MPNKPSCFAMIAIILLFAGCHNAGNALYGVWFYTYSRGTAIEKDTVLTAANFIYLQKDGSYTRDFGSFDYGKWIVEDKKLFLISYKHEKNTLSINYHSGNDMQLGFDLNPNADFENQPATFTSDSQNPFSKDNNTWRIPALTKETDIAIKNRLLNHFKFWEAYFTWALDNELQGIDVRSTPTLLKIYGNGFTLKPYDQLPAKWKSFFYDEEDCKKANELLTRIFRSGNIAWPHTDNKYKLFISAFRQLQQLTLKA